MLSAAWKLSAVNVVSVAGLNLHNHHYVPFLANAIHVTEIIVRSGIPHGRLVGTRWCGFIHD